MDKRAEQTEVEHEILHDMAEVVIKWKALSNAMDRFFEDLHKINIKRNDEH